MNHRELLFLFLILPSFLFSQERMQWPNDATVAVSLSFDDARESQVLNGTEIFDRYGIKATFYVVPSAVKKQLDGWKKAVASKHEIGNHTLTHPCTGNFGWSRNNALEDLDIDKMEYELLECNRQVKELLGIDCKVFAYPCGQKFIGRDTQTRSYVPLVATHFNTGRGWMDEAPNDPFFYNRAQLTCIESDGKTFEQLVSVIDAARKTGAWVIFGGHEIDKKGAQTTRVKVLEKLLKYATDQRNGIWIAPVGEVEQYIRSKTGRPN